METLIINRFYDRNKLRDMNIVIGEDVEFGESVVIQQGVSILGKCKIGDGCIIESNSNISNSILGPFVHVRASFIEDSVVADKCEIGPFAHIRAGSKIGESCRIGNFVEVKNSNIGVGVKIAHLTYVGDADIGECTNVGCGVVFCNYNGKEKLRTIVGEKVFIGSNVNLIAPVKISDGAFIAAGSTINHDVAQGEFSIARARQVNRADFKNPYTENK